MPDSLKHPLKEWLDKKAISYRQVAARCKRAGVMKEPSAKYIEHIAIGWQRPGSGIAVYIAETITKGDVSLHELLTFPYRRPPNPKRNTKAA